MLRRLPLAALAIACPIALTATPDAPRDTAKPGKARAAVSSTAAPAPVPAAPPLVVYRLETGRGVLYATDHPMQSGDVVSFHEHPGGTLVSIRRSEIRRVVVERLERTASGPKPGDAIDLGITGGGSANRASGGGGSAAASRSTAPGSRPDGTALFNPDRKYQPDIDSKQVPGLNTGFPNSANDYREGRTLGYPAARAVQSAPGDPPKMPESKPN